MSSFKFQPNQSLSQMSKMFKYSHIEKEKILSDTKNFTLKIPIEMFYPTVHIHIYQTKYKSNATHHFWFLKSIIFIVNLMAHWFPSLGQERVKRNAWISEQSCLMSRSKVITEQARHDTLIKVCMVIRYHLSSK